MVRKASTIIGICFLVSACCEKEGSWLNTVIKNHAAKIAAAQALESKATESTSALSANAAVIPVEKLDTIDLQKPTVDETSNSDTQTDQIKDVEKITGQPENEIVETNSLNLNSAVIKKEAEQDPGGLEVENKTSDIVETIAKPSGQDTNPEAINIDNANKSDTASDNEKTEVAKVEANETNSPTITQQSIDTLTREANNSNQEKTDHSLQRAKLDFDVQDDHNESKNALSKQNKPTTTIESKTPVLNTENTFEEQQSYELQELAEIKVKAEEELITEAPIAEETVSNSEQIDDQAKKLSDLISLLNEEDNTAIDQIVEQAKLQVEQEPSLETEADKNQRLLELLSKDIKQVSPSNSKMSSESLELLNEILSD